MPFGVLDEVPARLSRLWQCLDQGGARIVLVLVLAEAGAASQLRAAQTMRLERSTPSAAADELEQAGLIGRRRDPADRRLNELTLTRRGRALVPQIRKARNATEKRLLNGLPLKDRSTLEAALSTIVATADTAGEHDC